MLTPRLTNCPQCADIPTLISEIDCKLSELSGALYNNTIYMLNKTINKEAIFDLLNYKKILMYKICNLDYAGNFTVNMIANRIKLLKYK